MVEDFEADQRANAVGADAGGESSIKGELKSGFNYRRD